MKNLPLAKAFGKVSGKYVVNFTLSLVYAYVIYSVLAFGLIAGLHLAFGMRLTLVRVLGVALSGLSGLITGKLVLKDWSYEHGKAVNQGELAAMQIAMAKAVHMQQHQDQGIDAQSQQLIEEAQKFLKDRGDDGFGPLGMMM